MLNKQKKVEKWLIPRSFSALMRLYLLFSSPLSSSISSSPFPLHSSLWVTGLTLFNCLFYIQLEERIAQKEQYQSQIKSQNEMLVQVGKQVTGSLCPAPARHAGNWIKQNL